MYGLLLVLASAAVVVFAQQEVPIEKYLYHVGLLHKGLRVCGATLIQFDVAITALQCTIGRLEGDLTVRGGTNCTECEGGVSVSVVNKCEHPKYDGVSKDYDIVVLVLSEKITTLTTMPLKPKGSEVSPGDSGYIVGWGFQDSDNNELKPLQMIKSVRISPKSCRDAYTNYKTVTDRMNCYTDPSNRNCKGEFGSGLIVSNMMVGIASWGPRAVCGNGVHPAVYTKIAHAEISDFITGCMSSF